MLARSVQANVLHCNAAISAYGKGGQWQLALSLLSSMPDISIVPSKISYNAAISACSKGGQWQLALGLLTNIMPDMRIVPDEISYSAAISACGKGRQWQLALSLLSSMPDMGVITDEISFNAAISACEKAGQWQPALSLLSGMPDMRVIPDKVSYNAAISACEKGGQWQLALNLLSLMPEQRVVPNAISYNAAISACKKAGSWQLALNLLSLMPEVGVSPDVITYNTAITACEKRGQWQLALKLLSLMPQVGLVQNEITFSATISAFEKGGQWQLALDLLSRMPDVRVVPVAITYNAAISSCSKGSQWQLALRLLSLMPEMTLVPNEITYSAAISACGNGGQWQLALDLLSLMPEARVVPNTVTYNAAVSACEKSGQWQLALKLLSRMPDARVVPSEITYSAAISACEKVGHWQLALGLLSLMPDARVLPDVITYNSAISACEKASQWQLALNLLSLMPEARVVPNEITYNAAITVCERSQQLERGLQLLWESKERVGSLSVAYFPWALARLSVHDPDIISAAFDDVALKLSISQLAPQELSMIAWAFGMLGVHNPTLFHALVMQAVPQLQSFTIGDLLKLGWGSAASGLDVELFMAIQNEVVSRLKQVDLHNLSELSRSAFLQDTLGLLWASNFAGYCSGNLLASARLVIRQAGASMDRPHGPSSSPACQNIGELPCTEADPWQPASKPQAILDLPDRLVIFKPSGWEVYDQHSELQLSSFLQATLGKHFAIMHDEEHQCGFLHRLDLPSSGLVLAAKTYEAYYDLKVQLNAGEIARDYVILCHGWVRPCLTNIKAKVYWRGLLPTSVGDQGKPSLTRLKVTAHARHRATALSLVAVRIATGRRHQIRSHFSHVGHPTVRDGKYTCEATFQSDQDICARNFLHRYRLAFKDLAGKDHEVMMPLPADLMISLQRVTSRDTQSAEAICDWLSGRSLRSWQNYIPLIPDFGGEQGDTKQEARTVAAGTGPSEQDA
ncbi:unnamed protein product [Polarella glacialis]|uniref:Pseudouridine synthase RsuA/RluA-like domain-containing protein n=1 Tax=Polarella glacialis TaxID=89957 RepID=A0A813J278_POLGL|nr:unnamed protein product [Polarella glacialis]